MRIVIDMQGAQTASRFRGIGRYTMAFAQAVVRNRGEHEVILALSGLFPDTIEPIRAAFEGLLPQENIRVWHAPGPVRECEPGNDSRREVAELLREAFLASLQPDVIHICSLFEGYVDDAVTSIGRFDTQMPVSVILYDLIPLRNPDHYLKPNPRFEQYYRRKIEFLKKAARHLAISEFSRREAIAELGINDNRVIDIAAAIDGHFQPLAIDSATTSQIKQKFSIDRPFVLYTGGLDERKNLPRLIEAYAGLSRHLRKTHQLVFAGKMPEGDIAGLRQIAYRAGLADDELLFTGYVSDEELVQLYNLCALYVFPSWHEGFGLPALEAMACGAPVIGANTTSLPEVIGLDEALFDPFDVGSILQKMARALDDETFRAQLREHGLQQAKKFSWDETARRAIAAWETVEHRQRDANDYLPRSTAYARLTNALANAMSGRNEADCLALAHAMALNEGAGIERQLLLDVSELSQRDAATGVQRVVRSYLKWLLQSPPAGFRVEPVYATREEGYRYARRFTQRFLGQDDAEAADDPVRWQRGDIFFGLDMQHHVQLTHAAFYRQLVREGVTVKFLVYDLLPIQLVDLFKDANAKALHEQWLTMIAATDGAICISKATADAYNDWIAQASVSPAPTFRTTWVHIGGDIESSKPSKGVPSDAPAVLNKIRSRPSFLCVSTLEPRKGQQQILEAVQQLWAEGMDVNLVLVGQQGWKIEALAETLRQHPEQGERLFWLQGISDEYLAQVYAACTVLIAASLNEGFGLSLIEAAQNKLPIIARDIPVFREVAGEHAFYFTGDQPAELATALKAWLNLYQNGQHPRSDGLNWLTWQQCTEKLKVALVQENYPRRQLLVDISSLVQRDHKTGIQRVVRSILREWLLNPPKGCCVEPVYATLEQGYQYARKFLSNFMGYVEFLKDDPIDYAPGDVFLGLDFNHHIPITHKPFLEKMRWCGVHVNFVVYDILPIKFPHFWEPQYSIDRIHSQWLHVITNLGNAICISKSVAEELKEWLETTPSLSMRKNKIEWFHLGADIENSQPTQGIPPEAGAVIAQLTGRPTFLMVGTLEPRKGHAQVLGAFNKLWHRGLNVNLAIVGKQGWLVDDLVRQLRLHPELNKRLFWLDSVSDEYLEDIYAASTCLIAASYGEGFGLPLIEAAQHKLPIIARDIPVFREVAGEHAFYFDAADAAGLAESIRQWLALYRTDGQPKSDNMPWLTWRESAQKLSELLLDI